MPPAAPTYPDWKAPAEDGTVLLWPDPQALCRQTLENQRMLASAETRVGGLALREVRARMREWIGHRNPDQPLVASGHQTELHHPGVWVKDVLINAAARRIGGAAFHFAVDTDAPKHLELHWPGFSAPITDDPSSHGAHWTGRLAPPTPAHLEHLQAAVAAANFPEPPMVGHFLNELRRLSLADEPNLPASLTSAAHAVDWSLGLRHHVMLTSPMWLSEPYLIFAHHLIARARAFAGDYNAALADYRREKKVRTPARPMPDLAAFEGSCELPFWLDDLADGSRTRPSAFAAGDGFVLGLAGGDEFHFDPRRPGIDAAPQLRAFLIRNQLRLAPRALTLTLFLRLFVADQFVHGIGGGHYDQVTDRIIAAHFGLAPPAFSVTTATMYLPQALGRPRACVPCVVTEGHRLKHSLLGPRKRELVAQIASAPRHSRQRYLKFLEMHRELKTAAMNHPAIARWEQHVRDVRRQQLEEASLFDRELFYLLQPRARLDAMIARYDRDFLVN
jgi:hypothetical protein